MLGSAVGFAHGTGTVLGLFFCLLYIMTRYPNRFSEAVWWSRREVYAANFCIPYWTMAGYPLVARVRMSMDQMPCAKNFLRRICIHFYDKASGGGMKPKSLIWENPEMKDWHWEVAYFHHSQEHIPLYLLQLPFICWWDFRRSYIIFNLDSAGKRKGNLEHLR